MYKVMDCGMRVEAHINMCIDLKSVVEKQCERYTWSETSDGSRVVTAAKRVSGCCV